MIVFKNKWHSATKKCTLPDNREILVSLYDGRKYVFTVKQYKEYIIKASKGDKRISPPRYWLKIPKI